MTDDSHDKFQPPIVSWVLCTHLWNEQLKTAIRSCLNQTFTSIELVLVVNGPSGEDITAALQSWIGEDPRVRIVRTEIRRLNFSLSLGLHHSRGEYVARMDGDDVSRPDRIERQVDFLNKHRSVTVLGSAYEVIDADDNFLKLVRLPSDDRSIRAHLLRGNPFCHPSVMYRRSAVLEVGGYLGGVHAEDYDLWTRLAEKPGNRFANLEDALISYRSVGVGTARRSRLAYASVAATQLSVFVQTFSIKWALAAALTICKALIRSRS